MAERRIAMLLVSLRYDGGAEALTRTLIDEFADQPYRIELFVMGNVNEERAREFTERGIPFSTFPARRLISPRRFVRLVRAIRGGGYDVIHTHLPSANMLGLTAGALLHIPVVVTLHNTETTADRHWYHGRLEAFLLRRLADRVIAVGTRTARARRRVLGNTKVHVLDNAVAPTPDLPDDAARRLRGEVMTDPERHLLLTVGRLTEQKAHDELLHSFAELRELRGDVELVIAGRGPLMEQLEALVVELGLEGWVHLLGMRPDVRELMQVADVFVMSSHWEGLPVALLEAMQAGLPVVSTDVGDVPEVLRGGCGTLVAAGDTSALARAISQMVADLRPECGDANRRVVDERYSSKAWASTIIRHYEAAIAAHQLGGSAPTPVE